MKKSNILTFFICLLISASLFAQKEGEIAYKESIKFDFELPEGFDKEMAKNIPTSQSFFKVLYFTETESMYKDMDEDQENEITHETTNDEGNMQVKMVIARPDNQLYQNFETGKKVEKRDFMGKKFLIRDDITKNKWKMTGEQKKVMDYVCMKATLEEEDRKVEAWFTPQIPASVGPGNLGGLPGAVLEVSINEGERTISAVKIDLKEVDKSVMEAPTKGKEVTEEELDKIMDEKMKEMGQESGGGAVIKIRTN